MPAKRGVKKRSAARVVVPETKNDRQRQEILRAAAALFAEKGYGGTKLHHIAEAMNLTRTAFYYYFKNKEQLLAALVEDVTFTLQRRLAGIEGQKHLPPDEMLRAVVRNYATLVMDLAVEFRFVSRTESEFPKPMAKAQDRAKRQVLDSFISVINRGVQSGQFEVADGRVTSLAIIGMCNWSAWWFKASGGLSTSQIADLFVDLALQMVIRPPTSQRAGDEIRQEVESLRQRLISLDRTLSNRADS